MMEGRQVAAPAFGTSFFRRSNKGMGHLRPEGYSGSTPSAAPGRLEPMIRDGIG